MKKFILLLSILLSTYTAHADMNSGEVKELKNWVVGCNNIRTCEAISLMPEDFSESTIITLHIKRLGTPNTPAKLYLTEDSFTGNASTFNPGTAISFKINDKIFDLGTATVKSIDEGISIPEKYIMGIIEESKKATDAYLVANGTNYKISLAGLSAALLYIDEQQQHLGTTTALIRKGTKAMTSKSPQVPTLKASIYPDQKQKYALTAQQVESVNKILNKECEGEEHSKTYTTTDRLSKNTYLLMALCYQAAYNEDYLAFVVPNNSNNVELAKFKANTASQDESLTNATFEVNKGTLTTYAKGRGIGDCGISSTWVWTGKQFELAEFNSMPACRGISDQINTWTAKIIY